MSLSNYFLRQDARPKKKYPTEEGANMTGGDDANAANATEQHATEQHANTNTTQETEAGIRAALREVVNEVTANVTKAMDEKLAPILELLKNQSDALDSHDKRLTEAELRVSALEDAADPVKAKVEGLRKTVDFLTERVDELENRGRRMNVRILNLPEGVEGTNPTRFFERWLPEVLHIEAKHARVKLERAHRSIAPIPSSSQRPRAVIVRFHNYQDKQRVMNASWELARKNQAVKHGDSRVMFFQDFSAAVVRKRKGYDAVKKRLRALGAEYGFIYPAKLKISYRGSNRVFNDPADVEQYITAMDGDTRDGDE